MIRRSTIVYLVLLLVLAGAYYYLNNREQPADTEATAEPVAEVSYLFTAEEGTPSSIRMESKSGQIVEVAREAEGPWMVTQPVEAEADQAAAEAAASQVTTMRILDTVPDVDPKIIGLENPEYVLTIKFTSGPERTVDVGIVTPTQSGFYVRDTTNQIVIVSRSAIDSLLALLENPPYRPTEIPSPVPEADTPPSATAAP